MLPQASLELAEALPSVVSVEPATEAVIEDVWVHLDVETREYFHSDPHYIDLDRVRQLAFADGRTGAALLGGECCFVTIVAFAGSGHRAVVQFCEVTAYNEERGGKSVLCESVGA